MSYKGSISRLSGFGAKLKEKLPAIKATITLFENAPKAKIKPISQYNATIKKSVSFAGVIKKLNLIFRFFSAKARIVNKHKANATSALSVDAEAKSTIKASKETQISVHPSKEISVDQKERLSVSAKLNAYRRAGCRYIKKLFFKRKSKAIAAPGTIAKYSKILKLEKSSKAISAGSSIMESQFNMIAHNHEAAGGSAPAHIVPAIENTFSAEHMAKASKGTTVDVNIDSLLNVNHDAKMVTWIEPVVVDGVLILRQAYSATKENDILVVE